MMIEKKPRFLRALSNILTHIAKDKKSAAKKFEATLNQKITNLTHFPYKNRASIYFDDERYRDLIFAGYTIIYKIETEQILILEIFKWQNR